MLFTAKSQECSSRAYFYKEVDFSERDDELYILSGDFKYKESLLTLGDSLTFMVKTNMVPSSYFRRIIPLTVMERATILLLQFQSSWGIPALFIMVGAVLRLFALL